MRRYAIVTGARSAAEVSAYMPGNYRVDGSVRNGPIDGGRLEVVVSGEDRYGWTLEDYVRPRLGSGLMGCEEIDLSHPIMKQIPLRKRARLLS